MHDPLANFRTTCALIASLLHVEAIRPVRHASTIAVDFLAALAVRLRIDSDRALELVAIYLDEARINKLAFVAPVED